MNPTVGQIEYISRIDTSKMRADAAQADAIAKKTGDSVGSNMEAGESRASAAMEKMAKVAKVAGVAVGVALVGATVAAAKASWDQVAAVEQATVGLRAYEKDGSKVNQVLSDLIKYARSDMGVLFNRKDLFQSAQMLKLNGVATEDLAKNVEILSRSVGLGLGNWQDLNAVVGRVVATGRLSGIEFDQLTQYGFKLDKSLRNTNVSATDLFKILDKGIPVDAMAGQANSIRGISIRLQTAFRGIGDAILGVDADTSKFIEGGLGDRLVKGLGNASTALKNFKPTVAAMSAGFLEFTDKVAQTASQVGEYLAPKLQALGNTIQGALPTLMNFLNVFVKPLAEAFGVALVTGIGLAIDAINLLILVLEPLLHWMNEHKDVVTAVVAAIGAYYATMKAVEAFEAFKTALYGARTALALTQASIGATIAEHGLLKTALSTPLSLSILIGGALIALQLVYDKYLATKAAMEGEESARQGANKAREDAIQGLNAIAKGRAPGNAQAARNTLKAWGVPGYARGTMNAPGGWSMVGERGPELINLPHGSKVIPNDQIDNYSGGGSNHITINLSGIMARSRSDERDIAKSLIGAINEELRAKNQPMIGVPA